jgi:hypothetical protein
MTRPLKARLGMQGHAAVLAHLKATPSTFDDLLAADLIGSHSNGYILLASLHRLLRIHISGWREQRGRHMQAVWAYGCGDDAPAPSHRAGGARRVQSVFVPAALRIPPAYLALDMLMTELEAPHTTLELVELTGLDPRTVRAALRGLGRLVAAAGRRGRADQWQLREAAAPRNNRLATGDAYRSVSSVFALGHALQSA